MDVTLTPLPDDHFPLLVHWLNAPHVQAWWRDGTGPPSRSGEVWSASGAGFSNPYFVIEADGWRAGRSDPALPARRLSGVGAAVGVEPAAGTDYLIGDSAYPGKGIGSTAIALAADHAHSPPTRRWIGWWRCRRQTTRRRAARWRRPDSPSRGPRSGLRRPVRLRPGRDLRQGPAALAGNRARRSRPRAGHLWPRLARSRRSRWENPMVAAKRGAMRSFDPVRLGLYEADAWVAYYRRRWPAFLFAAIGMVRIGFGLGSARASRGAWYVLRANQLWAPWPDNDAAGARTQMLKFYGLIRRTYAGARSTSKPPRPWRSLVARTSRAPASGSLPGGGRSPGAWWMHSPRCTPTSYGGARRTR